MLIEYVSSNPTGPLHVGHGRGAVFGSVLAKLLTAAGHEVDEEYYVNDHGRQMSILTASVWLRYMQISREDIAMSGLGYQGNYIKLIADDLYKENKQKYLLSDDDHKNILPLLENQEDEKDIDSLIKFMRETLEERFSEIKSFALNYMINIIKIDLIRFGVDHNLWFFESSLYDKKSGEKSKADKAISELTSNNFVFEEGGALWFKSSEFKDDKNRVLQRSNGDHTYFSSDVAYHLDKYKRSYDRIINIWGSDHHGYLPRVRAAMEASNQDIDKLETVFIQFANLVRNGEKISMSTRSGEFIALSELLDEVTPEAARFFYINRKADQHLEFDLELAKEQTKDNPLYYIQYAHARICSVFNKVGYKLTEDNKNIDLALLSAEKELEIQVPMACEVSARIENPSPNHFSTNCEDTYDKEKLDLISAKNNILDNYSVNSENKQSKYDPLFKLEKQNIGNSGIWVMDKKTQGLSAFGHMSDWKTYNRFNGDIDPTTGRKFPAAFMISQGYYSPKTYLDINSLKVKLRKCYGGECLVNQFDVGSCIEPTAQKYIEYLDKKIYDTTIEYL